MASCDAQLISGGVGIGIDSAAPSNDNPSVVDACASNACAEVAEHPTDIWASKARADLAEPTDGAPVRARVGTRAQQTIPPSVRRAVLQRDQHRCRVPGCKNATFLDLHHIQPRSEGGSNHPENLLTLCGAHHRAAHRGQLIIERNSSGLRFLHADGRLYGDVGGPSVDRQAPDGQSLVSERPSTHVPSIEAKVASALRDLGFRDADVRAVLAQLRQQRRAENASTDGAPSTMTAERLLREALILLGPKQSARM
jgi:hypothetical protein